MAEAPDAENTSGFQLPVMEYHYVEMATQAVTNQTMSKAYNDHRLENAMIISVGDEPDMIHFMSRKAAGLAKQPIYHVA
jgi:hypothetical protein